jgi:hypothetical protein
MRQIVTIGVTVITSYHDDCHCVGCLAADGATEHAEHGGILTRRGKVDPHPERGTEETLPAESHDDQGASRHETQHDGHGSD